MLAEDKKLDMDYVDHLRQLEAIELEIAEVRKERLEVAKTLAGKLKELEYHKKNVLDELEEDRTRCKIPRLPLE